MTTTRTISEFHIKIVGEDEPLEDEMEAIREYEERKKRREVEFTPLEEILGE